jgi:hypothetical protein
MLNKGKSIGHKYSIEQGIKRESPTSCEVRGDFLVGFVVRSAFFAVEVHDVRPRRVDGKTTSLGVLKSSDFAVEVHDVRPRRVDGKTTSLGVLKSSDFVVEFHDVRPRRVDGKTTSLGVLRLISHDVRSR